jgi:large subunit ribosomal protein L4
MKIAVYNQNAEKAGELELSEAIFGVKSNTALVHQVYVAMRANARAPWADSKDRGEVSGGGKKPWKQKGTGRARHGSIRSPIWKGGGVTFGPLSVRNYQQKINKKMNQAAVKVCLSDKVKDEKMVVLEELSPANKTKELSAWVTKLPGTGRRRLLLLDDKNETFSRAVKNIKTLTLAKTSDVNVIDLISYPYLIVTKKGIEILTKRLA